MCPMAPRSQPSASKAGQRKISNFFKPQPDATAARLSNRPGDSPQQVHSTRDSPAEPVEPPAKRAKLSPNHDPVSHSAGDVIALDDDSDGLDESVPPRPAAPRTNDINGHTAQPSSRTAASIPARHAGRHLRFQQKLARPSPKEPVAGDAAPKQPFTPLELQIVDLKRRHPGVLLVVEVCSVSCLASFPKQNIPQLHASATECHRTLSHWCCCRSGGCVSDAAAAAPTIHLPTHAPVVERRAHGL